MPGNRVWLELANNKVVVRKQFVTPTTNKDGTVLDPSDRHKSQAHWLRATQHLPTVNLVDIDVLSLTVTTEYAAGRTLAHPTFTEDEVVKGLIRTCAAIQQLHDRGIAHGAMRPAHVLVGSKQVWLCGATGLATDPAVDAVAFANMLKELTCLRFAIPEPQPNVNRLRGRAQRSRHKKSHDRWDFACAAIHSGFTQRLPNKAHLAQLFDLTI